MTQKGYNPTIYEVRSYQQDTTSYVIVAEIMDDYDAIQFALYKKQLNSRYFYYTVVDNLSNKTMFDSRD